MFARDIKMASVSGSSVPEATPYIHKQKLELDLMRYPFKDKCYII